MEHTGLPHDHGEEQNHTAAMRELLRDEGHFQRIADIFRQLGDPSRIRIFWLLCHCEECVVNIADMVDMSSPAVSHHLRVLKDSGLLDSRREDRGHCLRRGQLYDPEDDRGICRGRRSQEGHEGRAEGL